MRTRVLVLAATASLVLAAAGCGGASDSHEATADSGAAEGASKTISLVAYSTPQVVYDEILPAFAETPEGTGVKVKTSFGASGEQSRAVEGGLDADVVSFSVEPDVTRLVKSGLVEDTWVDAPHEGLVTTSVVSFIVRQGNPKNIRTWDDLVRDGVEVLTPNPFTSGAAKWNILAAYGAKGGGGKAPEQGLAFVEELLTEHVEVQDKSGREALQNFLNGKGDVLLSYEYEATTALKKGAEVDYVVPEDTIRIEIPIVVTKAGDETATALRDYAISEPAQERFASWGYRPVDEKVLQAHQADFPTPAGLFTIDDLGGWTKVDKELFDPDTGSIAAIEEAAGVSTEK
jgi:sulfate transport system substrate-binding protein